MFFPTLFFRERVTGVRTPSALEATEVFVSRSLLEQSGRRGKEHLGRAQGAKASHGGVALLAIAVQPTLSQAWPRD